MLLGLFWELLFILKHFPLLIYRSVLEIRYGKSYLMERAYVCQKTMKDLREPLSDKSSWGCKEGTGRLSISMGRLSPKMVFSPRLISDCLRAGSYQRHSLWRQGSSQLTRWPGFTEHACGAKPLAPVIIYSDLLRGWRWGNTKFFIGHQSGSC